MEIRLVGAELFHAGERENMLTLQFCERSSNHRLSGTMMSRILAQQYAVGGG
jgi:hypothetical protein